MKVFPRAIAVWAAALTLLLGVIRLDAAVPPPVPGRDLTDPYPPFRLIFSAYDGNPKVDPPDAMVFQVNTVDVKQPAEFLKLGQTVTDTPLQLTKFRYKKDLDPKTGKHADVSELTVTNKITGKELVLILGRITNAGGIYQPPPKPTK